MHRHTTCHWGAVLAVMMATLMGACGQFVEESVGTAGAADPVYNLDWYRKHAFEHLPCYEGATFANGAVYSADGVLISNIDEGASLFGGDWGKVEILIDEYMGSARSALGDQKKWPLDGARGVSRVDAWFTHAYLMPYVQRVIVTPQTKVAVFGDLHGTVHSFIRELSELQRQGYIDHNFRVVDQHLHDFIIIFCGDYVDRGYYGVEVLSILLRLKLANPANVFLVRGNHEDEVMNDAHNGGSFKDELIAKFPNVPRKKLWKVFNVYDTMPMALFLGVQADSAASTQQQRSNSAQTSHSDNAPNTKYLLFVHGGIELGYDANPLLSLPYEVRDRGFTVENAIIHALRRADWLHSQSDTLQSSISDRVKKILSNYGHAADDSREGSVVEHHAYPVGPTGSDPHNGFMWWDFFVHNAEASIAVRPGRGLVLGKRVTLAWLAANSVVAVFRAHQHNDNAAVGPMLSEIRNAGGVFDNWNHSGIVFTTLSGAWIPSMDFGYDSFLLLNLHAAQPASWEIDHCRHVVGQWYVRAQRKWLQRVPPAHFSPTVDVACDEEIRFQCSRTNWDRQLMSQVSIAVNPVL